MGGDTQAVCKLRDPMVCEARVVREGRLKFESCSKDMYEVLLQEAKDEALKYAKIVFGWSNRNYTEATIKFNKFDESTPYIPGYNEIGTSLNKSGTHGGTTVSWTMSGEFYCTKVETEDPK